MRWVTENEHRKHIQWAALHLFRLMANLWSPDEAFSLLVFLRSNAPTFLSHTVQSS
jgi:hypothetical protein